MSYQVLARKYRPKNFSTLVGQEHVVRALTHALEQQRLHHAYLFTGTRGVGKTTLSRILAKSLNCETGVTANPCGQCEACLAIDAGRFVDYIEMDAASNRGVDEMASLLEQAIYAPSNARYKVYMIDEVHMLTNHAFNAMLKTLEEPPAHVKFILATTDPQKIPVTVLSRCLQFNLKQMPPGHIVSHLENILTQEQISFEVPALRLLAQGAHGSMRDALSLTDQAIAYAAGTVSLSAVQGMLGALDQAYLLRIVEALVQQDGQALLAVADEMAARSLSYKNALQDLAGLLQQIALAQLVPAALATDVPERENLLSLAQQLDAETVQLFYQIAVHGRNDLGLAPDEYAGFTMCLLRMLAFHPARMAAAPTNSAQTGPSAALPRRPVAMASAPGQAMMAAQTSNSKPESSPPAAQNGSATPAIPAPTAHQAVAAATPATNLTPAASNASRPANPAAAALAAARAASMKTQGKASTPNPVSAPAPHHPAVVNPPSASTNSIVANNLSQAATSTAVAQDTAPVLATSQVVTASATPAKTVGQIVKPAVQSASAATPEIDLPPWDLPDSLPESVAAMAMDDLPPPWDDYQAAPAPAAFAASDLSAATPVAPEPAPKNLPAPVLAADRELATGAVAELNWDGNWPALAAQLPVRGITQQLAQQSELVRCQREGNTQVFKLRVPLPTLLSAGSVEKLNEALTQKFNCAVRIESEIGAVELTANAEAIAARDLKQKQAESSIASDGFVQALIRDFAASVVASSIRPI